MQKSISKATKQPRVNKNHAPSYFEERIALIEIGKLYSYRELCELLGAEVLKGNTAIAQRTVWKSYFSIESIGYRLKVTEIYTKKDFNSLFSTGEEHIRNSAILLLEHFNKSIYKTPCEKFPEISELLFYSKDIGSICGYLPLGFYTSRTSYRQNSKNTIVENYFYNIVGAKFSELTRNLLKSLQTKGVIAHSRRVLTKFSADKRIVLTDEEEAKYNTIVKDYILLTYPSRTNFTTFGFTRKDWVELNKLTTRVGANIYQGFYVAFVEKSVENGIEELKKENGMHFSKKVIEIFARDRAEAIRSLSQEELSSKKTLFLQKIWNREMLVESDKELKGLVDVLTDEVEKEFERVRAEGERFAKERV